jgi:hypothetical protein
MNPFSNFYMGRGAHNLLREESFFILVLTNYLSEEKEKEKKTSWGGDIVSRGTKEPQAPTNFKFYLSRTSLEVYFNPKFCIS